MSKQQRAQGTLDVFLTLYNDADSLRRFINEHGGQAKRPQPAKKRHVHKHDDDESHDPVNQVVDLMFDLVLDAHASTQRQAFAYMQTLPTVQAY